jgi:FkbM family methyltransferase
MLGGFLRAYHRTSLRGKTLLTLFLARRFKSLQAVPIRIADWPPVYMDMRYQNSHEWFVGTPFESSPHEVNEQAVMRRFVNAGDIVFDIGANLGLHTMLLARLVGPQGQVVAFEPNGELLPMLERTIDGLQNIKLYPYALSEENVETELFVPDDHSMGSLADWNQEEHSPGVSGLFGLGTTHTVTCQQRRMDELIKSESLRVPDFIKCDVEGAELMVFKGGSGTLNRADAPIILFEAIAETARGFGLSVSAAAEFLASLPRAGYQFLEVCEGGELSPIQHTNFTHPNIVAIPQSKRDRCPELG